MKAKKGYSGLDSFPLSFNSKQTDLMSVAGNDARIRRIGELFDNGSEDEARDLLRQALREVTQNLDSVLSDRDIPAPPVLGTLLLNEEL